jgi:hypothetical protein
MSFSTHSRILFSSEYFHYKIFIHEKMLRKLKWQLPEPLATRYNWCQGPVPGCGPAVEKHCPTSFVDDIRLKNFCAPLFITNGCVFELCLVWTVWSVVIWLHSVMNGGLLTSVLITFFFIFIHSKVTTEARLQWIDRTGEYETNTLDIFWWQFIVHLSPTLEFIMDFVISEALYILSLWITGLPPPVVLWPNAGHGLLILRFLDHTQ